MRFRRSPSPTPAGKINVTPLIDVLARLSRSTSQLIPPQTQPYFQDVHDHVVRIAELINNLEQLSHIALEAKFALISVAQNEDTKRLAAWAEQQARTTRGQAHRELRAPSAITLKY